MGLNVLYIQSNNKNNVVVVSPKPYACNDISSCIMWTLCAATGGLGFASGGRILLLSKWMSKCQNEITASGDTKIPQNS